MSVRKSWHQPRKRDRERAEFVTRMIIEGMDADVAYTIMRYATTYTRLCTQVLSYDDPVKVDCINAALPIEQQGDFGSGEVCPVCDGRNRAHGQIPKVKAQMYGWARKLQALMFWFNEQKLQTWGVVLDEDPRGVCVKIRVPSGKTNDIGGEGICVPVRRD